MIVLFLAAMLSVSSCAKTVTNFAAAGKTIVFQFSVKGAFLLNNPNITYYIVLNVPQEKDAQIEVTTDGPRINGPANNDTNALPTGRLPFLGQLPQDIESKWTHFYYIQGTPDGAGNVGIGEKRENGVAFTELNYNKSFWKRVNNSTFELQILFGNLFGTKVPKNIAVNLATSDNIETGNGFVYDSWRLNVPFSIETANQVLFQDQDPGVGLVMRDLSIFNKPLPQLPAGVSADSVDITSYSYVIR